jgi:hypothetical protein
MCRTGANAQSQFEKLRIFAKMKLRIIAKIKRHFCFNPTEEMNTLKKSDDPGHLAITSSPSLKIILTTGTGAAAYTQIQELQYLYIY